jgi:hypothetical protein
MSWSFGAGNNPPIDYPRILTGDMNPVAPIFQDESILAIEQIVTTPFQSGMFFSTPNGAIGGGTLGTYLPQIPIPYYRVAAIMLNSMASMQAWPSAVTELLDVKLNGPAAVKALQNLAQSYLDLDDNSGAFVIVEQVNNDWSFRDRYWRQYQRQSQGSF